MDANSVTCSLFGRVAAGAEAERIRREWDFDWRRSTSNGDSRFSVDIPLPTSTLELGIALDGIIRRDQPVLRALSGETAIDLDIAIWFEPANVHPVVFDGDWLSACGREFEIWAEVSHSERDADALVSPSTDVVTVTWRGDGQERRAQIVEAAAERRQELLIKAMDEAIADGTEQVAIELAASFGIAGMVISADLVAALAANRVGLVLTGHRSDEDSEDAFSDPA